jgi:hypothetical protein
MSEPITSNDIVEFEGRRCLVGDLVERRDDGDYRRIFWVDAGTLRNGMAPERMLVKVGRWEPPAPERAQADDGREGQG